jgi:hypothetical protein
MHLIRLEFEFMAERIGAMEAMVSSALMETI